MNHPFDSIRPLCPEERGLLAGFLYEAIFQLPGAMPLPMSIIEEPELRVYIENFGQQEDYLMALTLQ